MAASRRKPLTEQQIDSFIDDLDNDDFSDSDDGKFTWNLPVIVFFVVHI